MGVASHFLLLDKYHDQKQLEEKGVCFTLQLTAFMEGEGTVEAWNLEARSNRCRKNRGKCCVLVRSPWYA